MRGAGEAGRAPLAVAAVLVAGLVMLALETGSALAQLFPQSRQGAALFDAEAQHLAALQALEAGKRAEARAHALHSLALMPWNQGALTLATIDSGGARGLAALNLSAAFGWRDPLTNARLIRAAFAENQPATAAERIDALGRIADPLMAGRLADELLALPGGVDAMAGRAARHESYGWMPQWLAVAPKDRATAAARAALVQRIDADDGAWRRRMVERAMTGFNTAGLHEEAWALWQATLSDPALRRGDLYDTRFTRLGEPFALGGEWTFPANPGAVAERAEGGGMALTVLGGDPGQVVSQQLRFSGAHLAFSAHWRGDAALAPSFAWGVSCAGGGPVPLARSTAAEPGGWRDDYAATLPAGCRLGYLSLAMVARPAGDATLTLRALEPGAAK